MSAQYLATLVTSVYSALRDFVTMRCTNLLLPLPLPLTIDELQQT